MSPPHTPPRYRPGIDTPHSPLPRPPPPAPLSSNPSSASTSSPLGTRHAQKLAAQWSQLDLSDTLSQLAQLIAASIMEKHTFEGEESPYVRRIAAAAAEYIRVLLEREELVKRAAREKREAMKRLMGLVWGEGGMDESVVSEEDDRLW